MSSGWYTEDNCSHEGWECRGGWHDCNDCARGLGSRDNKLEEHAAETCSLCGPVYPTSSCIHNDQQICVECSAVIEVRLGPAKVDVCTHDEAVLCINCEPSWVRRMANSVVSQQQDEMDVPYGMPPKFVTKDSGKREQFDSGMQRDTQEGKARWDLLFPQDVPYNEQFLTRVAELLARGAEKYDARNWEQAAGEVELDRFKSSALRHMMQWAAGDTDEDHASAVVFNLLGAETLRWKMEQ